MNLARTAAIAALAGSTFASGLMLNLPTVRAADPVAGLEEVAPPTAGPEGRVRAGVLACEIEGGIGFIIGSSKKVACSYDNGDGSTETYVGTIGRFGLDIGFTGTQYMRWVVFAPQGEGGDFSGSYAGVSAQGSLGIGFGANALIGGSDKSFVLQPVSVQTGTGLNVAAGVSTLTLQRAS